MSVSDKTAGKPRKPSEMFLLFGCLSGDSGGQNSDNSLFNSERTVIETAILSFSKAFFKYT